MLHAQIFLQSCLQVLLPASQIYSTVLASCVMNNTIELMWLKNDQVEKEPKSPNLISLNGHTSRCASTVWGRDKHKPRLDTARRNACENRG